MAKYEQRLLGNLDELLTLIEHEIIEGSVSANLEDGSDYAAGGVRCAVRVFERYSLMGGNRVSLNVTVVGEGENLFLSAITSGGSQAVFFKVNTLGEEAFLDCVIDVVRQYQRGH